MKKSVKILTLVLSLALICGALVVAAFANEETAVVGVRLDNYADFEGSKYAPGGEKIPTYETNNNAAPTTAIDNDAGTSKAVQFKHQKGGQPVLLVNPVDNNTYVTVDWTQNPNSSSGHFFDTYTVASAWKNYTDDTGEYWGTETKYFVMDVDVKWDNPAAYDGTGFFYPYIGYTNAAGTGHVAVSDYVGLRFPKTTDGKVGVQIKGDAEIYEIGSDGTWSHVTYIMGFEKVTDDDGENLVLKQWLAIDGVIVDSYNWTNTAKAADVYKNDRTLLFTKDIRFDVFGRKDTSGSADNYMIRTLTADYNGNLATVLEGTDLTAWESAVYTADYVMPFGELVAMIGDTPYDDMAKAFEDAEDGDTITLKANVTDPVVFDKMITVEGGEYTIETYSAVQGYMVVYDEETNTYTVESAQGEFYITWESCTCDRDDCDETHPGGFDTVGWEGGSIGAAYAENEDGKTLDWTLVDGYYTYYIAGWVDEEGNPVDVNTIITAEMCDDISEIILTPVIGILSSSFAYTKGDDIAFTDNFKTALDDVTENGTITLLKDAKYTPGATTAISKSVTIDLNGYVFDVLVASKFNCFNVSANKTLTFKGEKEGSAVVNGYPRAAGNTASAGTFLTSANATIRFVGPNLTVSTAALYGNWGSSTITIELDGVNFTNNGGSDNPATIYHKGSATINIKNSIIENALNFVGLTNSGVESTLNVQNSVVLGGLVNSNYKEVDVTISESYVGYEIYGKSVTVGKDCYFNKNNWVGTATFDEGVTLSNMTGTIAHEYITHPWIATDNIEWDHEATLVFGTAQKDVTYTYTTAKPVDVEVYDGETLLKTITSAPGAKFLAYEATGVSLADGWVKRSTKYWYTVAEDATAKVTVDIADITDRGVSYDAGTPNLYFNHALHDNLTANLYVPVVLPEGVEITNINLNGQIDGRKLDGNYTIGGVAYQKTQAWPQGQNADEGVYWIVTYTYDGRTIDYKVAPNIVSYAQKVVELYKTETEKMQQITALLQYVEACNKVYGGTISNGLSDYLAELKATYTLPAAPEAVGNLVQLMPYITGAKMTVVAGKGGAFAFTLNTENAANVTFNISIPVEGSDPRVVLTKVENGQLIITGDYLPAWGAKDFNIDVLDAEGAVIATGTYSLAAYKTEMAASATVDELSLLDAIYALAYIGNTID